MLNIILSPEDYKVNIQEEKKKKSLPSWGSHSSRRIDQKKEKKKTHNISDADKVYGEKESREADFKAMCNLQRTASGFTI